MNFPAKFEPDDSGGFVVTFRDIPEAITQGETKAEALEMAEDALITAMEFYFEDNRPVPAPSPVQADEVLIDVPISVSAKVLLLNEMLSQKVTNAELARLLGVKPQEVQRVVDLGHATKIDTVAKAMHALGKRLDVIAA